MSDGTDTTQEIITLIYVEQEAEICENSQFNQIFTQDDPSSTLTDMYNMAFAVNHDVSIVSVLDLENVAHDRVRRHRLYEVKTSLLELDGVFATVLGNEEVQEVVDLRSSHLVTGGRVWDDVDNTTLKNVNERCAILWMWNERTPGAVAVTRYGNK